MEGLPDPLRANWDEAWRALGASPRPVLLAETAARWREPHRHYHTLQHLGECMEHFAQARHLAAAPGEIALALWFHDAVYDVHRKDSEELSAALARRAMREAGAAEEACGRVAALVLATRHDAQPAPGDEALLTDIDLAILGAAPARFGEYERQVRREYAHVPDEAFRAGRTALLRRLLARDALYATPFFHGRYELAARRNLERSLAGAP